MLYYPKNFHAITLVNNKVSVLKMNKRIKKKAKENVNVTRGSQAVTHPSTNRAQRCLTSVIGREPVLSAWYGR